MNTLHWINFVVSHISRRLFQPLALVIWAAILPVASISQTATPQIAVASMPTLAQLTASFPEGPKEDAKYVLLGTPDLASSGSLRVRISSELPSTTLLALYVGPSTTGSEWSPVGVFQFSPRLMSALDVLLRNERTQAYTLVAIANEKLYRVTREMKLVLSKPVVAK